jgi:hypothetical protein
MRFDGEELVIAHTKPFMGEAPKAAGETDWKGPTVPIRYRKVNFGQPVLQVKWVGMRDGKPVTEWRDVPVESV